MSEKSFICENFKDNQDEVFAEKVIEDRYLVGVTPKTQKRICSCCEFYDKPTYVACRHCVGFDKFECKYSDFEEKARKLEEVSGMSLDTLIEYYTMMRNTLEPLADKFDRASLTEYGIEVKDDEQN